MTVMTQRAQRTEQQDLVAVMTQTETFYISVYGGNGGVVTLYFGPGNAQLGSFAPLRGEDYPALVRLWDNDVDAVYDTI